MKGPTREEMRKAQGSFVVIDDVPELTVVDRTPLENWSLCPFRADCLDKGLVNFPAVLHVGNEVHGALSRATHHWIESDGQLSPGELRDTLMGELRGSRPDLQPQVIQACAASAWSWAAFLNANCHPGNILGFDGGDDLDKSGQLAIDFEDLNARPTSELDLLYSGPSAELLHEVDYKGGHKHHTAAHVANSFQFQFHALLVFLNFPEVRGLEVTVWDTRTNSRTYKVVFDRRRLGDYSARVRMAVQSWATNRDNPPAWPTAAKCEQCEAAYLCPVAGAAIANASRDPVAMLNELCAVEAKADAIRKVLAARVDATGQEIVAGEIAFGRNKPKSNRKTPATIYKVLTASDDAEEAA